MTKSQLPYCYQVGLVLARSIFLPAGARVTGKENFPSTGSVLIVSNHQSFLDPVFVALANPKRQIHYMAKEELFRNPTARHMLLGLGAFAVDRGGTSKRTLAKVLSLLREGRCVCLFAEGTRSKDGSLGAFQPGFARIAQKTRTPVLPVALSGSRNLFESIQGPSLPFWSQFIGSQPPRLQIGELIPPDLPPSEIVERAHGTIKALLEDCSPGRTNPPS